jgi:hypothetical protein
MKLLAALVTVAVTTAVTSMLYGWVLMLLVGIVHSLWLPALPTLGFWSATLIALLVRAFIAPVDYSVKTEG